MTTRTNWPLVCLLLGAGILSAFQVGKVPPVLQDIRSDMTISLFHAGWVLSIFNLIGLVLGTCTGAIADTLGHRRLMLTGMGCQALGSFSGAFAPNFEWLLFTRFLEGMGFLAVIVSTPPLIVQIAKEKDMKTALSIWSCYLPAGAALMMALMPMILGFTNWQGLWQINSLVLVLYTLILFRFTRQLAPTTLGRQIKPAALVSDIIKTLTSPGPLVLALIFTTYAMQWLAVMGFLPTLLLEKYQVSKTQASLLTAAMVFMNVFGNLAGGWLLRKGIRRWRLIAMASLGMGCCAMAIYAPGKIFMVNYCGCLMFSLVGGLIPASAIGGAPVYAPSKTMIATTMGLIIQGGQSGQVFGPPILAFLVSATGTWSVGAYFLSSVALAGVMFSLILARIKHP